MAEHGAGDGGNVSRVRNQLQNYSDFNLAYKLQEEEFGHLYDHNRTERRLVGGDTRTAKQKHLDELIRAHEERKKEAQRIAESDEQIARRLQEHYNRAYSNQQSSSSNQISQNSEVLASIPAISPPQYDPPTHSNQLVSAHPSGFFPALPPVDLNWQAPKTVDEQVEEDARIAKEMAARYEPPPGNLENDERIARRLQEKYDRRRQRAEQAQQETIPRRSTLEQADRGADRCIDCHGPMPAISLATNSPENARRCNECRKRHHEEPPPYNVALLCSTPTCAPPVSFGWNSSGIQAERRVPQAEVTPREQVAISHLIGETPMGRPRQHIHTQLPPPSQLAIGGESLDSPLPPPPPVSEPAKPETQSSSIARFHPTNPFLQDLIQLNDDNTS
ncbi:hypothetical protein QR680_004778 [Steinernema hermaphroditum]|uniref:Coiled-coil domain-containing protein n=1 Tax=Steinernema hermaphroditum TaxID=289476 RepID=A0AA39LU83_9BILA|nr:hypothetical protein QR680_004778 [Steinernema hermaphroditum]